MATEVGELEPISESLHSIEAGMLDSSKGEIIIEAPIKETILQYVTTVSEKLYNEGCLTGNGNKDDAAKEFIQIDTSAVNVMDAERITDDQVTKFDMIEVSEAQVRDRGDEAQGKTKLQKLEEVHEDEHDEREATAGKFSKERVNDIDSKKSTIKSLETETEESPLDAIAMEMEAEKHERLYEDKHVLEAESGRLNDESSTEIILVAEPSKPSEHAGNAKEDGKLESLLDAVPKDSESLKIERAIEDKHVEIEVETGGLSDERSNKDISSVHVTEPAEEESIRESLQIYTKENLEPAEDEPGGGKLESPLDAIPDEAEADNLQRVSEEKHDKEEDEKGSLSEKITNEPLEIADKEKLEPAEDEPEGGKLETTIHMVPDESSEENLERVNEDEHVKIEAETGIFNDESSVKIVSVPKTSETENMQKPLEITTEGDAEVEGDEPECGEIESSLEPVLKEPEAKKLERVEEDLPVIQTGESNDEISNEIDHLSLAQPAEEENTQDPLKTITEEDPEPARDEPEDAKLESPLDAVLKKPEAEKLERVEEDKHDAETKIFNDERGTDIDSIPYAEEENTKEPLETMTGDDPEPAGEEPEGRKLESSLNEFPKETEAEKLERTYEEKHVEKEAETGSFIDERAKNIDSIYITEPSEKLNTQEPLEIVTKEDLYPAEDEIKGENPLDAVLEGPEATTQPSMLPHSIPNSGGVTSQHEIETISKEREVEVELVLEEITAGTNSENLNSESDKKDEEVKNDDNQNDLAGEESLNSASEDQVNNETTVSNNDIKDNHFNEMTSMELELASELILEEKSEEARIETKDAKIENSTNDENNSNKSTEISKLSMEDEAANEKVEDSNEIDAIKETTEEASNMHENTINADNEELNQKASSMNTGTNEVRDEIEIANEENKSSNEFDMAKGTANNVSEMDKDSTNSASELSETIDKDVVLQETHINSDKTSPPDSQAHEHSHDPIVDSEAANEDINTFEEIDTKDKADEDLSTSQASEKDSIWEATETKVDSELMVEEDIHEKTEETRSIEGEVTPQMSSLEEQMVTEDLDKNNDLEVEQGKESSIAAVDGERSLEETEGDKFIDSVTEKDICEDKVQTPSKVVVDEIVELNDSQEVEKMESFEEKEEYFANKDNQEVAEKGTEDLSYRADDAQAEITEMVEPNDDKENEISEVNIIGDVYEKETKAENFKIITESLSEDKCQKEKKEFNPIEINSTNDDNNNLTMPRVDDLNENAETTNKNGEANQITEKGDSFGCPALDVQSLSYMIPEIVSDTHVVIVKGAYDAVDEKHENVHQIVCAESNKEVIVEEETENQDINLESAPIENTPNPDKDEKLSNIIVVNDNEEISGLSLEENGVENNYELESRVKLEQNDKFEIKDEEVQIKEENVNNILEDTSRTANINSVEVNIDGQIEGKEGTNKNADSETIGYKEEWEFENARLEVAKGDQNEERCDDNSMNGTAVEELIDEFETANEENIISNEDTAIEEGEMYEDAINSTGGLNQTIIDPIQQKIEADSEEASQPISKEQEQRCDSIVDSEAASADIDTFGGVKTTNKAIEDLSTSQASKEENTREQTELEVAKEQIYTETNEDEIQDRSIVEDTKFMVEKDIHEKTGELRSIKGEVTPETISLDEQKVTENLNKNNDLEVEQGKELYEVAVDGERSLEETEVDKTIDGVEKENWQDKVENPSKVVDEEIIKINDSREIEKGDSFEEKEHFANKVEVGLKLEQAVVGMDTEVLSSRADDEHAELINEVENANEENISSNEDNMDKDTTIEEAEKCEGATNYTSELSQTINKDPIQQDKEVDSEETSQPISQEQEPKRDSIVDSEAASANIDTVSVVNTTNKAIEDLSTSQASKEENIRKETELKVAKEKISTETNEDEIQDRSIVDATECMVEKDTHEKTGELRSIEGEVTPGTSSLDDQKVTENLNKDNELEVDQEKESYEVAVNGERSLEDTEGDKTTEGVTEKEIWEDKVENPSKVVDEEIIKINDLHKVKRGDSFEGKEECFANKDEVGQMLDQAVVGMDTEVLTSRTDDEHAEYINGVIEVATRDQNEERDGNNTKNGTAVEELINEFEDANEENISSNEENMAKDTALEGAVMCEDATNYTSELCQTINKDPIQQEKEVDYEEGSQPISQEQEPKRDSMVDSEAASANIDTFGEVDTTNKAVKDLSTSQASKEENIREATELKVAKKQIFTETSEDEIQARSTVEAPECMVEKDIHEKIGELRSIEGEVTPGTSSLDDQKVTENLNKNNELEVEQGKESYEVAVHGERSLEDTEGDKTIEGAMEKEIWENKVENPPKAVDEEIIKINDSQEVEKGDSFEGKEECFPNKDVVGLMLDQAVVGMDSEVLTSRADDEHAEIIERNELRNESEIEGGEMNEDATNSTIELSQIIDKDSTPKETEIDSDKASQPISLEQEHNDSIVDSEANTMEKALEEALENNIICEATYLKLAKEQISEIDSHKASQPISQEQEHNDSNSEANIMEIAIKEALENDIICEATNPKLAKEQISTENNEEEIHNTSTGEHTQIMVAKDIHESIEGETTQEMSSLEEQNLTANLENNAGLEVEQGKETSVAAVGGERSSEETLGHKIIDIVQQKEKWDDKIETPTKVVEEEIIEIDDSEQVEQRGTFQEKEVCLANAEISEMVGPDDDKENGKCEANLNKDFDGSPSSPESLEETKAGEVGETIKVNDEPNQNADAEAYKTDCEQNYQAINVKGDIEGDDHKEKGDAEEFGIIKESVPKEHNQEDICESEVTNNTIQNDNLDKVIPEIVGYACNLTTEEAKEAQNKEIYNDDTSETKVEEVKEPDVTVETPVSEDVSQVIKADAYELQAYEEKGESKENTHANLLLGKSVNDEGEKMNEILDDVAVTNVSSDETTHENLQGDQGQKATEEDFSTRDGNPNEDNDNTVTWNIESEVEELKDNESKIISDDNSQGIFAFNEESKQEENTHEKAANSSNEEKDHEELTGVVVCKNEAKSNGGEAFTSSLTSQEIEGDELHNTDEKISEEKLETLELNRNEGEEIPNKDMSSTEPSVPETEHLSLQSITKEEANQAVNDTDGEAKDDELVSQMNIESMGNILLQKEELGDKPQGKENKIETQQKSYETSDEKNIIENESFKEEETTENSSNKSKLEDHELEITPFVVLHHLERETATEDIHEGEIEKDSTENDKKENFQKDEDMMLVESVVESEQGNQINKSSCHTEVLEAHEKAEQSDIITTQIEKIAERSEALNIRLQENVSQEMATPIENIEKEIVSDKEVNEVNESAVNTVPNDEDEETTQEVGEKFSKISDYWPGGYKEETLHVNAMGIECSKEILTEAERSACGIDVKGEEVLYVAKDSEVDCKGGEQKLDEKVSFSVEPIEDKESSQVVTGTEVIKKATHENDESDNLPVSQFLMKHILQEQADNLRIGDEKFEDSIKKLNEEGKEDEVKILEKEEVQLIKHTTIPEDEVGSDEFENRSGSVQEDQNYDVKEKSDTPVVKDDASILSEVSPHRFRDDRMELKSTEQSIQGSKVDIEECTDPNVVEDEKNQATAVEEKMTEKEMQNENEIQEKYVDILKREGDEESKESHQDIEKVESQRQSTMEDSKIEESLEIESEVMKEESGEEKQEGSEESKEFHQENEKVESERQSTMDDYKIGEIFEIESGVTKEESGEEKQDVGTNVEGVVKEELQLPETQNTDELQIKKVKEEYEPNHSGQNAEIIGQTSEVEPIQKCDPTSKTSESSAVKDLKSKEEKEDVIHGNQPQIEKVTSTEVEEDKTDDEKDEKEDEDAKKLEESSNEATMTMEPREVELKPTHKKSHNILSVVGSKVKHSIAKVKKAITGKSSHTKTLSAK